MYICRLQDLLYTISIGIYIHIHVQRKTKAVSHHIRIVFGIDQMFLIE